MGVPRLTASASLAGDPSVQAIEPENQTDNIDSEDGHELATADHRLERIVDDGVQQHAGDDGKTAENDIGDLRSDPMQETFVVCHWCYSFSSAVVLTELMSVSISWCSRIAWSCWTSVSRTVIRSSISSRQTDSCNCS